MTELLYYHDSYQVEFRAHVIDRLTQGDRHGLILDRTLFYPTSGGQPFDRGDINGLEVEEVLVGDQDGEVIHYLAVDPQSGDMSGDEVRGTIEWPRRFDHMQQHTGQHILSQAIERVAGAATASFHMGEESSTLDLDIEWLTGEQLEHSERLANQVVWENRNVAVQFASAEDAAKLMLRKIPPAKDGLLRLVSVDSFDLSACGGTHVRRTGEIGIIKIVKMERAGGKCRLEFLCGNRALGDYDRKNLVLANLSNELTTGYWELENSVVRLRSELKEANRALKRKTEELIRLEAANLALDAVNVDGVNIIRHGFDSRELAELRKLAGHLAANDRTAVLLGLAGPKAQLLFASSADLQLGLDQVLASVLPLLGDATGGGSPRFAQGGGPPAGGSEIERALVAAEKLIQEKLAHSQPGF